MITYKVNVYLCGTKHWFLKGNVHREDGPAVEYADGKVEWHLNNEWMTETQHKERMNPPVEMTMEEICKALGKTIKVVKT
jgi:hypothetical protein